MKIKRVKLTGPMVYLQTHWIIAVLFLLVVLKGGYLPNRQFLLFKQQQKTNKNKHRNEEGVGERVW